MGASAAAMPDDAERVERFLGEFRMLVAAVGVLVAFQLQAVFSQAFLDAGTWLQGLHVAGTLFGIAAFASFLIPASVHRVASEAENADRFIRLARRAIGAGFSFLGVALVLAVLVQATRTLGRGAGIAMAALVLVVLVVAWWWIPHRFSRKAQDEE